ncbi:hypothetical protein [Planctomycetes bacterium K23_9]|uniref:hypothetical protein n=1 Tax=Stieleria marina TaxID=1930275 RepID=UPI0011A4F9A7
MAKIRYHPAQPVLSATSFKPPPRNLAREHNHISLPRFQQTNLPVTALAPIDALRGSLEQIRESWQTNQTQPTLLTLPERLHGEYQSHRETSPLGRVFRIANSMQDQIDAVVVVGDSSSLAATRAIFRACCDPMHNELTRAERGSRPRIYFAGDTDDIDSLNSLLHRLSTPTCESAPNAFALVVINEDDNASYVPKVLPHLLDTLHSQLRQQSDALLPRFLIPFAKPGNWLDTLARSIGCHEIFDAGDDALTLNPLALANHLPAAMLGLDCMRLLGGAHEIKEHFLNTPADQNIVLQYVAACRQSRSNLGLVQRVFNVPCLALESFGHWYERLVTTTGGKIQQERFQTRVCPQDNHRRPLLSTDTLVVDLKVLSTRTDAPLTRQVWFGDDVVAEIANERELQAPTACATICPSVSLTIPQIDTFTMGQLFQWFLIATAVENAIRDSGR